MKLVMTLLCRDDAEIIDANIRFHLEQGIDYVIAMNNLSDDESASVLKDYERSGVLALIDQREDNFDQDRWVTQMARMAASAIRADWVINNDADEFWWPSRGNLKDVLTALSETVEMVLVPRNNFLPAEIETRSFHERMRIRDARSCNALGEPLPGKVCHRGYADIDVSFGNHGAQRAGAALHAIDGAHEIDILHFPLRSYAQFERKIMLGAAAINRNARLDRGIGSTWRWLWEEHKQGRLREYYQKQILDPAAVSEGLRSGTLVQDDRLYQFFRSRLRAERGDRRRWPAGCPTSPTSWC
jgi:Glycosyl transferase family 2